MTLNIFDVCNDDTSKFDRFFCFELKPEPSNRTELDVHSSTFDKLKSEEKMSFSSGTESNDKQ